MALNRISDSNVYNPLTLNTLKVDGNLNVTGSVALYSTNTGRSGSIPFVTPGPNSQATWSNYPVGFGTMVNAAQNTNGGIPSVNFSYFLKIAQRDAEAGWAGISIDYGNGDLYSGVTSNSATYATWYKMANTTTGNSFVGTQTITPSGTLAVMLKGTASQGTSDIFLVQDSSSVTRSWITMTGMGHRGYVSAGDYFGENIALTARSLNAGNVVSAIRGAASQTADLTQWQNSAGTVLAKVDSTGNFTFGATVNLSDPGVGNPTTINFLKNSDNAWLKVTERATDATTYEFGMADNPDGSDFFQWRFDDWQNAGTGWMPLQIGEFTNRFIGKDNNIFGKVSLPYNSGFYTANNTSTAANNEVNRFYPSNSSSNTIPKDFGTGTGTLTPNAQSYTGAGATNYWVAIDGTGTFKWGNGSWSGTAVATGVTITGSAQTLSDGFTVTLSLSGHVVGDRWSVRAYPTPQFAIGGGALGSVTTSILAKSNFIGLAIRAASSQTANLQEWQDSAGNILKRLDNAANTYNSNRMFIGTQTYTANTLLVQSIGATTEVTSVIRAKASQTGDLTQWQNSAGGVVGNVDVNGKFISSDASASFQLGVSNFGNFSRVNSSGVLDLYSNNDVASNPGVNRGRLYFKSGTTTGLQFAVRGGTSGVETALFDNIDTAGTDTISIGSTVRASGGTLATASTGIGFLGMPQNSKSASYTFTAADAGKHIYVTTTGQTLTIPDNGTVALPIGTTFVVVNAAAVSTSIAITTDTLLLAGLGTTGTRTLGAHGMATILKISSTSWIISGNGLS